MDNVTEVGAEWARWLSGRVGHGLQGPGAGEVQSEFSRGAARRPRDRLLSLDQHERLTNRFRLMRRPSVEGSGGRATQVSLASVMGLPRYREHGAWRCH